MSPMRCVGADRGLAAWERTSAVDSYGDKLRVSPRYRRHVTHS